MANELSRTTPRSAVQAQMTAMVKALPQDEETQRRFQQAALAIASDRNLSDATPESVVRTIYQCARLALIPDPILQQAYIIPFRNNGRKEATLIVAYKGLMELARRAEPKLFVETGTVYENDKYMLNTGLRPTFQIVSQWWEEHDEPGNPVFSYCISNMPDQEKRLVIVSAKEGVAMAKQSRGGYQKGRPWFDHFTAMCEKTAVRRSAKLWSLSPSRKETKALLEAVAVDEMEAENLAAVPGDSDVDILPEPPPPAMPQPGDVRIGRVERATPPAEAPPPVAAAPFDCNGVHRVVNGVCENCGKHFPLDHPAPLERVESPLTEDEEDRRRVRLAHEEIDKLRKLTAAKKPKRSTTPQPLADVLPSVPKPSSFDNEYEQPAPPDEDQSDPAEDLDRVPYDWFVEHWRDARGLPPGKCASSVSKLFKFTYEVGWVEATGAQTRELRNRLMAGQIKYELFE
jgi:phage RecT family recombinase